jgi:putative transposase
MALGRGLRKDKWRDSIISGEPLITKVRCWKVMLPSAETAKAALKFLRKAMKRYGGPEVVVTDKLRSYGAAMKVVGNADRQETGRWCNNRAENSHLPFRRRERAMLRFRQMRCLQKFAAVHSSVHNHFNQERHFYSRDNFKLNRTAALAEWRQLLCA